MIITRATSIAIVVACVNGVPAWATESASSYPSKTVRLIVPQAPGGGIDFMARQIALKLSDSLGQQFIVDNRTGAGSTVGTAIAAKATPDGYTLVVNSISMAFNATMYRDLPYDTTRDLAATSLLATSPNVLVVPASSPSRSVQDIIRLAKASPGKLNFGSGGVGTSDHVCTEYFLRTAGIKVVNVTYKGSAPALVDLASGSLDFSIPPLASAQPLMKGGRLRGLAISTAKRSALVPEFPTIAESGLPMFDYSTWYALWATGGTPRAIVAKLNDAVRKAQQLPDVRERMALQGAEPAWLPVDQFNAFVQAEIVKWAPIIKELPAQ